jgi:hypothetical protein
MKNKKISARMGVLNVSDGIRPPNGARPASGKWVMFNELGNMGVEGGGFVNLSDPIQIPLTKSG